MKIQKISNVTVIGAGTMGPRIAYRCAVSGFNVKLYDNSAEALKKGMDQIRNWIDTKERESVLTGAEAAAARVRIGSAETMAECLREVDLVIETVSENLDLKRRVFAEIDRLAPKHTLIATNSSSMPCSAIAVVTGRPEKVFNINFSDPTHDMEVEIMKGQQTANETIIAGERFCRALGMVPIITLKEIMGFTFNRIWRAIKREALHLVDDGYSNFEDIDRAWMLCFGMPFGPFAFMDQIGLDVIRDIEMQYYLASKDERDRPPKILEDLVAEGRLGTKTGKGFYSYPDPVYKDRRWLLKQTPFDEGLASRLGLSKEVVEE